MPTEFKHRLALVVGVQKYEQAELGKLQNSAADAETIADALRSKAGFRIFGGCELVNPSGQELLRHVYEFCEEVQGLEDCLALVYFSGHGTVKLKTQNEHREAMHYLLAADFKLDSMPGGEAAALDLTACNLERQILAKLHSAKLKAAVVLIDACRSTDDLSGEPGTHKGWGGADNVRVSHAVGPDRKVLLACACAVYASASDGTASDGLGIFTRHILAVRLNSTAERFARFEEASLCVCVACETVPRF